MPRVGRKGPAAGAWGTQTLTFAKASWSREQASTWAQEHDFYGTPVDETENQYRIRQFDPEACSRDYRTLTDNMPEGLALVQCRAKGNRAMAASELVLYDPIGEEGSTARYVLEFLRGVDGDLIVAINSVGGDVFEAEAIFNALRRYDQTKGAVTCRIDALAASAASYIAMAGREVVMAPGAMMMLHSPLAFTMGNREHLRDIIDRLEKVEASMVRVYSRRSGQVEDIVRSMLAAETWLTAEEALEQGFIDRIDRELDLATAVYGDLSKYRHVPVQISALAHCRLGSERQLELLKKNRALAKLRAEQEAEASMIEVPEAGPNTATVEPEVTAEVTEAAEATDAADAAEAAEDAATTPVAPAVLAARKARATAMRAKARAWAMRLTTDQVAGSA